MFIQSLATNLSREEIETLAEQNKDYAQTHGISMRLADQKDKSDWVQILPTMLVPSKIPEKLFKEAYDVQKDISLLYHRVAFDYDFLKQTLAPVVQTDDFTRRLFDIYTTVYKKNCVDIQPLVLTIMRSDYMFHVQDDDSVVLRQVEVNTIAVGGAGLASNVTNMHRFMIRRGLYSNPDQEKFIPDNLALANVVIGLVQAYKAYGNSNSVIVMIIEDLNQNIMDQRMVEYEISKLTNPPILTKRLTLTECAEKLDLNSGKLVTKDNSLEVAVVYFRAGYSPTHYPSDKEWDARMMIEKSQAIKCPWIGAHLSGTKKVQQVLAKPNMLKRFIQDEESGQRIKNTFAGLYGLERDNPNTEVIIDNVCNKPENYVLKPQLEGGGNNVYGEDIAKLLKKLSPEQREAYILMDRLKPLSQENITVRAHQPLVLTKVDSELGTYGYILGSSSQVIEQGQYGHMIRTKPSHKNEGGIANGNAAHDSAFLF